MSEKQKQNLEAQFTGLVAPVVASKGPSGIFSLDPAGNIVRRNSNVEKKYSYLC